jgi:hypothetical protein
MLDMVGNRPLSDCRRALRPRATCVLRRSVEPRPLVRARQVKVLSLSPLVGQRLCVFVACHSGDDLAVPKHLVAAGQVTPVIDRSYALGESATPCGTRDKDTP